MALSPGEKWGLFIGAFALLLVLTAILGWFKLPRDLFPYGPDTDEGLKLSFFERAPVIGEWKRQSVERFDASGLFGIINGGAELYIKHGLTDGVYATYSTTGDQVCELFVERYKTEQSVEDLFTVIKANSSNIASVDGYLDNKVLASSALGSVLVFGRSGRYYFEIVVSGVENKDEGIKKVRTILDLLLQEA
jgi:hypothetical protein